MKFTYFLIVLLSLFPVSGFCNSKPEAPPEMNEIFSHFHEIEEHLEEKKWKDTREHTKAVKNL